MDVDDFIARWTVGDGGAERANYALFLCELCDVIGVERPQPASADAARNDYVFERFVRRPDGSNGRIDLYKRDALVLEAKQSRQSARTLTGDANDKYLPDAPSQAALPGLEAIDARGHRGARRGWDVLMLNARAQAEDYARHLPQDHGWPPFVLAQASHAGGRHLEPEHPEGRARVHSEEVGAKLAGQLRCSVLIEHDLPQPIAVSLGVRAPHLIALPRGPIAGMAHTGVLYSFKASVQEGGRRRLWIAGVHSDDGKRRLRSSPWASRRSPPARASKRSHCACRSLKQAMRLLALPASRVACCIGLPCPPRQSLT